MANFNEYDVGEKVKISDLLFCSMLIEALITYFNCFFINEFFNWKMIASMVLGVIVAIIYDMDFTKYFNLKSKIPYVGSIITGILFSRGSNYVYDLLNIFLKQ